MTEEKRQAFIKDKIAPIFDGMNADDILEILDTLRLRQVIFTQFTVLLKTP